MISEMNDLSERLKLEAQIWAQEARSQRAIVLEIYQALGIRCGDWNGALPVIARFEKLQREEGE